jgi:hypothetical protein
LQLAAQLDVVLQELENATAGAFVFVAPSIEEALPPAAAYGAFVGAWTSYVGSLLAHLAVVRQDCESLANEEACVDFSLGQQLAP